MSFIPLLKDLSTYKKANFRADLIAGITVAIMLVPQGMAYAFLAGMPPIYGLYTGLIPLFVYGLLGTSRQLSLGPVAISSLLVLAGVCQVAEPGTADYIALVILAGLLIGIAQSSLSLLRLGVLVNFLSHPVVAGFTSAAAIIIGISQLKDFLGIKIPRFTHSFETLQYAIQHFAETNWIAVGICIGSMVLMFILKKISRAIPGALICVVAASFLTYYLKLDQQNLDIVGAVPEGLPAFQLPSITLEKIRLLMPTVFTVTIIGIVESISIAKVLEAKHNNYTIQPNQEFMALGLSKILGAFFQAVPSSASFTRSAINNNAGATSGMASIITASFIGLTLLFCTKFFFYLPKAVLAAIILLAVFGLFDWKEAKSLWKTYKRDFVMMATTFLVTLIFGIEEGVMAGVLLSISTVLYRSSSPNIAILGNLDGTTAYRNIERFEEAVQVDDILILRFDNQLYFANAVYFKDQIKAMVNERDDQLKLLILDASTIHDMDSTGLHALEEIHLFLERKDIKLNISGAIGPVRDLLFKSGMMTAIGEDCQFLKIHHAIQHFRNNGVFPEAWQEKALQTNVDQEE